MNLCGIYTIKAKAAIDVITYYFLHFEEIMHRIDSIPRKRLNKEDLIHDLGRKCSMNRMEAQISYTIIKRAFKAFYHGTDMGGVPNTLLSNKLTHKSECLWVHAAQRTAQVYAAYEGLFYACQKDLECKIKLIYKQLFDRITNRSQTDDDYECTCMKCLKRIAKETLKSVKVTTGMHELQDPYEEIYLKEQEEMDLNKFLETEIETKPKCSCPTLNIIEKDYIYREIAESINRGLNRDPFDCRWLAVSKEEFEADETAINIKLPEEFLCPSCHSDKECIEDCKCSCETCTCKSEEDIFRDEFDGEEDFLSGEEDIISEDNVTVSDQDV